MENLSAYPAGRLLPAAGFGELSRAVASQGTRPVKAAGGRLSPEARLERLGRLKKACADLESIFIGSLLKAMRRTIPEGGFIPKSAGSEMYESMFDQEFSAFLSQGEGLGLGQLIFNQMVRREDLELLEGRHPNLKGLLYKKTIAPDLLRAPESRGLERQS